MVQVVAAIIMREGRILIGRRMAEQSHPLKWEFPGGKVEPGETPEQALGRELEEELGISGVDGREITRYQYTYPGKQPIALIFFRVKQFQGEPANLIFHEMAWARAAELAQFDFVEGDRDFIRGIYTGSYAVGD